MISVSHRPRQTNDAKDYQVEDLVLVDGRCYDGSHLWCKPTTKLRKEMGYTNVVFSKNTLMLNLEMGEKFLRENDLE